MRINDEQMRKAKAQIAYLGLRQNRMAADLGMENTRLNRILNGWLEARDEEKARIAAYLNERSASAA